MADSTSLSSLNPLSAVFVNLTSFTKSLESDLLLLNQVLKPVDEKSNNSSLFLNRCQLAASRLPFTDQLDDKIKKVSSQIIRLQQKQEPSLQDFVSLCKLMLSQNEQLINSTEEHLAAYGYAPPSKVQRLSSSDLQEAHSSNSPQSLNISQRQLRSSSILQRLPSQERKAKDFKEQTEEMNYAFRSPLNFSSRKTRRQSLTLEDFGGVSHSWQDDSRTPKRREMSTSFFLSGASPSMFSSPYQFSPTGPTPFKTPRFTQSVRSTSRKADNSTRAMLVSDVPNVEVFPPSPEKQ